MGEKNMTIRHLKVYVAVCRYGSFTGAAERLYMTQPAVSLAIRELEANYGVKLFDRFPRHIQMTEDGKRMLEYALNIVALFEDMEQSMKNPDAGGELKIGASLTLGACLLPQCIRKFENENPKVKTRVSVDHSANILCAVAEGALDLGLVEVSVSNELLTAIPFMEEELVAVCGKNHPLAKLERVTPELFAAQPILSREKGSAIRELTDELFASWGKSIEPRWESASTTALIRAVEAGNGVALLPGKLAEEPIQIGHVCALKLDPSPMRHAFYLVHHRKKYLSESIRRFMKIVMNFADETN